MINKRPCVIAILNRIISCVGCRLWDIVEIRSDMVSRFGIKKSGISVMISSGRGGNINYDMSYKATGRAG